MPLASAVAVARVKPDWAPVKPDCPEGTVWGSEAFHAAIARSLPLQQAFWEWYRANPAHFLRDCVRIVAKDGTVVPLDVTHPHFKRAQTFFMQHWLDQWWGSGRVRVVVLKARQWGCTTLCKGLDLWVMLFHPYSNCLTVADQQDGSEGIVDLLREMHANLPDWIRTKLDRKSRRQLQFDGWESKGLLQERPNRSWVRVGTAQNTRTGRKWRLTSWHGSEVAFWGAGAKQVITGCRNAVVRQGKSMIVLESTAYGWGGEFYREWVKACRETSDYRAVFSPWFAIDEYRLKPGSQELANLPGKVTDPEEMQRLLDLGDYEAAGLAEDEVELVRMAADHHFGPVDAEQLLWRRWAIENVCGGDIEVFHQEYPATPEEAFITTGEPTFSPRRLIEQMKQCVDYDDGTTLRQDYEVGELLGEGANLTWQQCVGGRVWVAFKPQPGHEYLVGVDSAEGDEVTEGRNVRRVVEDDEDVVLDKGDTPDNSSVQVFDRHTRTQVAKATGRFLPHDLADMALALAKWYNRAILIPEMNGGWGSEILQAAKEDEYDALYERIITDDSRQEQSSKFGWITTATALGGGTRNQMIATMKRRLHRREITLSFTSTVEEFQGMRGKKLPSGGVRHEAKSGMHDDEAFALMIAAEVDRLYSEAGEIVELVKSKEVAPGHPQYALWKRLQSVIHQKPETAYNEYA